jgi:hypothetical protein
MLDLSRVTLLFVETRAHAITKRVIDDCLAKADFGDVLIYSDKPDLIPISGARHILVPDFPDKREAGRFYYSEAMAKVETDFALMLEWDGGIYDPSKWKPEFFDYDYIGAPWRVRDQYDVGNGGFTLMSKKLGHFICENAEKYPVCTDIDICRAQRENYEAAGFKWPTALLASCFSWELGLRNPEHFGFHGAFTWPEVLPKEELVIRTGLLTETSYLMAKMYYLVRAAPEILKDLTPEQAERYVSIYGEPQPRIPGHIAGRYMSPQQRAAMMLVQAQRQGLISHQQKGLKA